MIPTLSMRKNPKLFPLMRLAGIVAPMAYWQASMEERAMVGNGCGPGGWLIDLIPDTLMGLSVENECNIHDWFYHYGNTVFDKAVGDHLFRYNLRSKIRMNSCDPLVLKTRLNLAETYYTAVAEHGFNAFFAGKLT